MTGYRNSLARLTSSRLDPETVKRDGWRETGILVVHPDDDRLDAFEREVFQRVGKRLYGEPNGATAANIRRLRP